MGFVNIYIRGLSASYWKRDVWNVIFPCDSHHRVKFDCEKSDGSVLPTVNMEFKKIHITGETTEEPNSNQYGNFDAVVDLTSEYLHKEGLKLNAKSTVGKTFMTVANAVFYGAGSKTHTVRVRKPKGVFTPVLNSFADKIGVIILLKEGQQLEMEIEGEDTRYFDSGDTLYFDNYCDECNNDFHIYQDMFENVSDNKIKFELDTRQIGQPIAELFGVQLNDDENLLGGPPPAFCDGTRISITDDL